MSLGVQDALGSKATSDSSEATKWLWQVFCLSCNLVLAAGGHPVVRNSLRNPKITNHLSNYRRQRHSELYRCALRFLSRQIGCLTLSSAITYTEEGYASIVQQEWQVLTVRRLMIVSSILNAVVRDF
jgi:hypothetical protein